MRRGIRRELGTAPREAAPLLTPELRRALAGRAGSTWVTVPVASSLFVPLGDVGRERGVLVDVELIEVELVTPAEPVAKLLYTTNSRRARLRSHRDRVEAARVTLWSLSTTAL